MAYAVPWVEGQDVFLGLFEHGGDLAQRSLEL